MKTFYLPEQLRDELKKVWGISIFGDEKEVSSMFDKMVRLKGFKKIITVGDYCSASLSSDVKIFDGKVKRVAVNYDLSADLKCYNPPGTIQAEAWAITEVAIKKNENVFVDGEEDLLVIPAVLLSDNGSAIVYGFPGKGICLIEVSDKVKEDFKKLLDKFEIK